MAKQDDDKPVIFKIAHLGGKQVSRRSFLKGMAVGAGALGLSAMMSGCENNIDIVSNNEGECICHVVSENHEFGSTHGDDNSSVYDNEYTGGVCTCNMVCTCDMVCTCQSVCTCDMVCTCESVCTCNSQGSSCSSCSSCGGHYWYPT